MHARCVIALEIGMFRKHANPFFNYLRKTAFTSRNHQVNSLLASVKTSKQQVKMNVKQEKVILCKSKLQERLLMFNMPLKEEFTVRVCPAFLRALLTSMRNIHREDPLE